MSACGRHYFLQVARGHWIRTDPCVARVACPVCGAQVGDPCVFSWGPCASTHYRRREAARPPYDTLPPG